MSAVEQALSRLNQVVGNLETSVQNLETNIAQNTAQAVPNVTPGQQHDMFGATPQPNGVANGNGQQIDSNAVAQKLDSAIENVEKILQEGAA